MTRRCACVKANVKCSVACHGGKNQDNTPDCPNISSIIMRTQRGFRVRDRDDDNDDGGKRRRRNTAGRWASSKGNDLTEMGPNKGKRGTKE